MIECRFCGRLGMDEQSGLWLQILWTANQDGADLDVYLTGCCLPCYRRRAAANTN